MSAEPAGRTSFFQNLIREWWLSVLVLISLFALGLVIWSTPLGVGVGYDSYFYLTAAENLSRGHGLGRFTAEGIWSPLTHYSPLYPVILSLATSLIPGEMSAAARIMGALLFGLNTLGVGLLVRWATGRPAWAVVAAAVFLISPFTFEQHLWAMSEPLFFSLLLLTSYLLARYLAEGGSLQLLILAAVGAGLAYLARYAALALLAAGFVVIISFRRLTWKSRLWQAAIYSAMVALTGLPWLLRNRSLTGLLTNRMLGFHPPRFDQLKMAGRTVAGWVGPPLVTAEIRLVLFVLFLGLVFLISLKWVLANWSDENELPPFAATLRIFLLLAVLYPMAVLSSLTLFDASTRLNDRIFSPLFMIVFLIVILVLYRHWPTINRWQKAVIGLISVLLFVLPYASRSAAVANAARNSGLGFNGRGWRQSAMVEVVERLPQEPLIYSNESFPLSYLTGREVFAVPEKIDPVKAVERPDYQEQLGTMRHRLKATLGYLVLFHPEDLRLEMPTLVEITEGMELQEVYGDGRIYRPEVEGQ